MKTKVLLAVVALSYWPLVVAGSEAAYLKEKVAAFVVENLDLTLLPSQFRPKKEKGKKTLADYGFTAQKMGENEAIIEAADGVRRLVIKVLDQKSSGIYVCVTEPRENGRYKSAKRGTAENGESEYVAKGARVVSRICCMSRDWWK
jgi:hypothetical protein